MLYDRSAQGDGGPPAWDAAWDRARQLLGRVQTEPTGVTGEWERADGLSSLAMALYIIAGTVGIEPAVVRRSQIEVRLACVGDETVADVMARWEADLREMGHDPQDPVDPVAVLWRHLRTDHEPPDRLWDDSGGYWGVAFHTSLRFVLAPVHGLNF